MFTSVGTARKCMLKLRAVKAFRLCVRCTHQQFVQNMTIIPKESEQGNLASLVLSNENRERCLEYMRLSPNLHFKGKTDRDEHKYAAVLIALCTNQEYGVSLLYTRRSATISRHVRQISFPGGIKDPSDVDYVDCALRETEEEIGLPRSRVEIWGTGALVRPPNTAAIKPVIGVVDDFDVNELRLNRHEVEEAFIIPISKLIEPNTLRYTQFKSGFSSPVFVVGHNRIWGITGLMTQQFLQCLLPQSLNTLKNRVRYVRPYKVDK